MTEEVLFSKFMCKDAQLSNPKRPSGMPNAFFCPPPTLSLGMDESVNLEFDSRVNWTNGLSSMEMKVIVCLFFPPTAPMVRQLQAGGQPAARKNEERSLGGLKFL